MLEELIKIEQLQKLEPETKEKILQNFQPYFDQLDEFGKDAFKLVVKSVDDKATIELAREGRLFTRKIRTDADKVRVNLKRDALDYGIAVQAVYKAIEERVLPIENHLKAQEDFVKVQQEKVLNEIRTKRAALLEPYISVMPAVMDLAMLTDDEFKATLEYGKDKFETLQRIEKEKQAETERLALIEQNHNTRKNEILTLDLWQYLEDKSMQFGVMTENDFKAVLSDLNKKRANDIAERKKLQEAKEKAEKEAAKLKAEQDKKDAEIAKQREAERLEFEAKMLKERQEREQLETQLKTEQEAKAKAEFEAGLERKRIEDEKAAQLKAPTKNRLLAWVSDAKMTIPEGLEDNAVAVDIVKRFGQFKVWAAGEINKM